MSSPLTGTHPWGIASLRNPAQRDFTWREYDTEQATDGSTYREKLGKCKDYTLTPAAPTHLQNVTETSRAARPDPDPLDSSSRRSESPSRYATLEGVFPSGSSRTGWKTQDSASYLQEPKDYEDEFHPLPSPTRSSLRSLGKGSSLKTKEGSRVTFADESLLDLSPKNFFTKPLETGDLTSSTAPKYGAASSSIDSSFRTSYLTSPPLRNKNPVSVEPTKGPHVAGTKAPSSEESSSERLMRLSSDLFVTAHLNDPPVSSATWRKGFRSISKTYTLPSKPSIVNAHSYAAKSETWNHESASGLASHNQCSTQPGMKRSSSLSALATTMNTHSDQYAGDVKLTTNGLKERGSLTGPQEISITNVLQQLMDLVDRYWNGSGSLLQNLKFMKPARELLSQLVSARTDLQTSHGDRGILVSDRAEDPWTSHGYSTNGDSMEYLKQQLLKIREENRILQAKLSKLEVGEAAGAQTTSTDELSVRYGKLSAQVALLQQQQLKQSYQQQDTASLLHQSQRALVSTNEYLLQQLKRSPMSSNHKAPASPSLRSGNTDKPFSPDPEAPSASHLRAPSYRRPEQLSQCPL